MSAEREAIAAGAAFWDREPDEYRMPCPNGCLGKTGFGVRGNQVPMYCGVNGCDHESPGLAYRPLDDDDAGDRAGGMGEGE